MPSDGVDMGPVSSGGALRLARLLVPEWLDVRGCVIRGEAYSPGAFEECWRAKSGNCRAVELAFNRVELASQVTDPDDEILREVARLLIAAWTVQLERLFPARAFDVELTDDGRGPAVCVASRTDGTS